MNKGVFVDSDVIISSLLSTKGAAYLLLNDLKGLFTISNISQKEIEKVADRLEISQDKLKFLLAKKFKKVMLPANLPEIKKAFQSYVKDPDDAHIVAGAAKSKAKFLLTYNIKDFNRQKISEDLGITVLTPAQYLQYLRSLE